MLLIGPPFTSYTYIWKLNHGQTIWDKKWGVIENVLKNKHIGNLGNILKTWWEHLKNLMGTQKNKKTPFHPPPKTQKKNIKTFPKLLIGCMKFLFPKQLSIFIFKNWPKWKNPLQRKKKHIKHSPKWGITTNLTNEALMGHVMTSFNIHVHYNTNWIILAPILIKPLRYFLSQNGDNAINLKHLSQATHHTLINFPILFYWLEWHATSFC